MSFRPLIRFLPPEFRIDFIGVRIYPMLLSAFLTVVSLGSIAVQGFNLGIDFAGGILIEVRSEKPVELGPLRGSLNNLGLGEVSLTTVGDDGRDVMIRVQQQEGGDAAQNEALKKVQGVLPDGFTLLRTEVVGPKVGAELMVDGALAVALALIGIAIYVWLRFEWQFALSALLALSHDVLTTLGLFSLFQIEFNLTTVAAILAIAGYSVNDTVVVFDRVRELLRKYRKLPLADVLNLASNQVFARTILTSVTTFMAVLALLIFGGDVLFSFSIAMAWGVLMGAYSTIYVAKPVIIYLGLTRDDMITGRPREQTPEHERPTPAE